MPTADGVKRWLVSVRRAHSYALAGSARWTSATPAGILLADVVPEAEPGGNGKQVVLSLHYQRGMRVIPARIQLDAKEDEQDRIPFVRLRMEEPVGRVFITWDGRRGEGD